MIGGRVSFVYVNKKASGKRVSDDLIPRSMLAKFVITTCVFDWGAQTKYSMFLGLGRMPKDFS